MPIATRDDIELYYERSGSGPRLLFISGTGSDLRFRPSVFESPLPGRFDVLAYDQRGLGRSSKPDRRYTMADYADDAAALMADQGWGEALVLGVSFGGMVAQELAVRYPALVRRLALACTSPGGAGGSSFPMHEISGLQGAARARRMIPLIDTRNDQGWAEANPQAYAQLLAMMGADPFADEPGRRVGALRQLEARAGHDVWDRLPQLACPVLVAAGRYDGIAPPEIQHRLAARIPGAELRFFDGGHMFMAQDPAALPAIMDFLARP